MYGSKKIYSCIIGLLEKGSLSHSDLVRRSTSELINKCTYNKLCVGDESLYRGHVGACINEMLENGLIIKDEGGLYSLRAEKNVILRAAKCESAILTLLKNAPQTKVQIREKLELTFGTSKTASKKDDTILLDLISQMLKRLQDYGVITLLGGKYSLSPTKYAKVDDIKQMLDLKDLFLSRLHAKGGEFFEHYFMTLLGKYAEAHDKTVLENSTTGGANDGGIDGIMKTKDSLGFKETVMVQTKNRLEPTKETAIRAFYGAVCAAMGSRGIFAITSSFHPSAKAFLDGIDNCVGIDSDRLFEMAKECSYGIKKREGKYYLDPKIL